MKITPIKNEAELDRALARVDELFDHDEPGTPEADELEVLLLLIRGYENKHWQMRDPTPLEAIRFIMEQNNLTQQDLVPYLGSRSRVSEILSGKRSLSLSMIRRLSDGLDIPLKYLVREASEEREEVAMEAAVANNPVVLRDGARKARRAGDAKAARVLEMAARA